MDPFWFVSHLVTNCWEYIGNIYTVLTVLVGHMGSMGRMLLICVVFTQRPFLLLIIYSKIIPFCQRFQWKLFRAITFCICYDECGAEAQL